MNYESIKKEAKKLLSIYKSDVSLVDTLRHGYEKKDALDILSKIKGYDSFGSFNNISHQNIHNTLTFETNISPWSLMDKDEPSIQFVGNDHFVVPGTRIYHITSPHTLYIDDSENILLKSVAKEAEKTSNLFIVSKKELEFFRQFKAFENSIVIDFKEAQCPKLDPINPMIGSDSYFSYFFHSSINQAIQDILEKGKEHGIIFKAKTFRNIFNLPFLFGVRKDFPSVEKYLENLGIETLETVTEEQINKHYEQSKTGYAFAQKIYENDFFSENEDFTLKSYNSKFKKQNTFIVLDFEHDEYLSNLIEQLVIEQMISIGVNDKEGYKNIYIFGIHKNFKRYNFYFYNDVKFTHIVSAENISKLDKQYLEDFLFRVSTIKISNNEYNIAKQMPDDLLLGICKKLPEKHRREFKGQFSIKQDIHTELKISSNVEIKYYC